SYGSQGDWVTGKTGQTPNPEHTGEFDEGRESETSAPHQGGDTSPLQASEHAMPSGPPTDDERKVSVKEGGAKRGGYFKERDYEGKK
ncbi:MAG: hypothetical protein WB973_11670, partial [Thermoanaerobaculia bacterium]